MTFFFFYCLPSPEFFLGWDRRNGDVKPTLDTALLCSSRVGSDLGRVSRLVGGALFIGLPHSQVELNSEAFAITIYQLLV